MNKIENIFPDININDVEMGQDDLKSIPDMLNIEEEELKIDLEDVVNNGNQSNLEKDYFFVRKKLIHSLQKGELILDNILKMAQMMESGKDYKVASQILQTMFEGSKALMDLHGQTLKLKKEMHWLPVEDTNKEVNKDDEKTLTELMNEIKEEEKDVK